MSKLTPTRPATTVLACAVPRTWASEPGSTAAIGSEVSSFDFVLVFNANQYRQVLEAAGQPILITRDFSVTDRRGKLRLRLGRLIEPWRLRRTLLNEGVSRLTILPGPGALAYRVAAIMGRVPVS
ncbi:hypothetical protein E3O42_03170 [Cryobacterium adonitolivorans]|uniref:Uncharacterized protein n=1 Tax=Cryobacterium adonitolivorans TaxID=1259189 RepID=A0A4R8WDZ9_9MICO|nr:hypothetical protein [Cryobacterium adonitolivorans]TFC05566.1 hypothetical protein E3O42_03170 [Cryobacterium adonitolivorans]